MEERTNFYIFDRQDITRAGLMYIIGQLGSYHCSYTEDKTELVEACKNDANAVCVIDYTQSDLNDVSDLQILSERFPQLQWIIFSEELSRDFIKTVTVTCPEVGILLKESPLNEIREALTFALQGKRYVCQRATEILLTPDKDNFERIKLTKTETDILRDIAMGLTTKEIAQKRVSSFHTVNTHRKNIFRKLGVNNAHEATRYAMRAGLVDAAEYYI